jgi:glutamate-1-semialdehyde 2,1-aminomutase
VLSAGSIPLCVTGWGSMMAIHSVRGPVGSPADLVDADPVLTELVFHELLHRGCYVAPRGFVALSLAIDDDLATRFVEVLADVVAVLR